MTEKKQQYENVEPDSDWYNNRMHGTVKNMRALIDNLITASATTLLHDPNLDKTDVCELIYNLTCARSAMDDVDEAINEVFNSKEKQNEGVIYA